MSLDAKEFVDAVDNSDFETLLQEGFTDFLDFVRETIDEGGSRVILRCSLEGEENGSAFPYYVWLVYRILMDGRKFSLEPRELFLPSEEVLESYYCVPKSLKDESFFSFIIE